MRSLGFPSAFSPVPAPSESCSHVLLSCKFPLFSQNPKKWQPSTTCWAYLQLWEQHSWCHSRKGWIFPDWVLRFLGYYSWDISLGHLLRLLPLLSQTYLKGLSFHPSQDQEKSDNWEGERGRTLTALQISLSPIYRGQSGRVIWTCDYWLLGL